MIKNLLIIILLMLSAFSMKGQVLSSADWLKTITANAISPQTGNKYQRANAGCALYFSQVGDIKVPYLVHVPEKYDPAKPAPVLIFLHGAILAKEDFQYKDPGVADEPIFAAADSFNALVIFPFSKSGFAWPAQQAACENVLTILEQVKRRYHTDDKRVYIGGISMGGHGTYWFINNRPAPFAGFYTFSAHPGSITNFRAITKERPLYALYAEDDASVPYEDVKRIYEQHKQEAPGWEVRSVNTGGHRFIYKAGGYRIMTWQLGKLLQQK